MSNRSSILVGDYTLTGTAVRFPKNDTIIFLFDTHTIPNISLEKYTLKLKDCVYLFDYTVIGVISQCVFDEETNTYIFKRPLGNISTHT